jgi:hypothetical protein
MFQKSRLDALSDGIFGVAMTLLILDVRLPDDFHPKDGAELVQGLLGLWPKFPALRPEFRRARLVLAFEHRGAQPGRIRQPRIRQLVAVLSLADHLCAVLRAALPC